MHSRSIRVRLLVWLSTLLMAVLVLASAVDYRQSLGLVWQAYDLSLSDAALGIVGFLTVDEGRAHFDIPEETVKLLQADAQDTVFYRVIDQAGRTLGGDDGVHLPAEGGKREPSGMLARQFFNDSVRGEPVRVFAQTITTTAGPYTILVAETTRKREEARTRILLGRLSSDALILGLTLVVVWVVVGVATQPLVRLADQLRRRSAEDLQPLAADDVPAEAQPLVDSLNQLLVRMADTRDGQRRFIENAAHQLRTPLAALKGQIDLTVNDAMRSLPADGGIVDRLRRAQTATNRLTHLANQLLSLARSDRPSQEMAGRHNVSLPELVDDVVSGCLDAALERNQDLGAESQPAELRAMSWALRELLTNLIDNAIRYTPTGGRITARCGVHDGEPYLEVEDDGPGIPPAERQKVFERFYRGASSPQGGSGLGLAIVKEIVNAHRARIEVGDPLSGGPGTRIRVTFPPF
ncbi:MAG: sensor histidine kinase N-terminal domain-containing protein [Burkholderiaceae bacterium]